MRTGCVVSCPVRMTSLMKKRERNEMDSGVITGKRRGTNKD
jgi:hypothetical protein